MKKKIINLLERFQNAYDTKDVEQIDQFMSQLFVDEESISILGTSFGELCLGYEECKKLFVDDWKYWTFEKLNISEMLIEDYGERILVHVPAYFSWTFKNSDGKYKNYIDSLKQQLNDTSDLEHTFHDINWILAHFFHQRKNNDRKYLYDLRVTFILKKLNDDVLVKQIQFSVPEDNPDARLSDSWVQETYPKEKEKLQKNHEDNKDIKEVMKTFVVNWNQEITEDITRYFHLDRLFVLNVNDKQARNKDDLIALLNEQKTMWDELEINYHEAYLNVDGDFATVITNGLGKRWIDKDKYLKETKDKIFDMLSTNETNKEKLFLVRKLISQTFRDVSQSDEYFWPIRIHLLLSKENNEWKIHYMQFSYPFYYILENKNRYMRLVD